MVESRISMRASSWSTPVSLLDFVKKKKSIEKSNFRQKSHLKIVLDSNYYILIVQLNQRDPIILKFRTQSNFQKNLTALLLKFLIRHVCPSKRKLAWTIEDGHISEDRTTFARDVVLDHFWSIESRQLRRKLALSHASSLSLSLHVQRDPDVSIFASLPLGKPPRLVEIRDRFARGTKDGRAHLCRFPFTFYRWKEFIVYR